MHNTIFDEILPQLAMRLKQEKMISECDDKFFEIPRVLVEEVNPENPKRFIRELVYPHIVGCFRKIEAYLIFLLNPQDRLINASKSK